MMVILAIAIDLVIPISALLSTKHIVVDQRFTLHLLLAQLLITCAVSIVKNRTYRPGLWQVCASRSCAQFADWTIQPSDFKMIVTTLSLAFSFPLYAQTFLYLPNFSTIPMLIGLASLTEFVASTYIFRAIGRVTRCCILAVPFMALVIVIFEDYRLTINGLVFGLLGMNTYFLAVFLVRFDSRGRLQSIQANNSDQALLQVALFISAFITGCWAYAIESQLSLHRILRIDPVVLVLNLATVPMTLISIPFTKSYQSLELPGQLRDDFDAFAKIIIFAGLCPLLNDFFGTPGYSTVLQISAFLGAHVIVLLHQWFQPSSPGYSMASVEDEAIPLDSSSGSDRDSAPNGIKDIPLRSLRTDAENADGERLGSSPAHPISNRPVYEAQTQPVRHNARRLSAGGCVCAAIVWIALLVANYNIFTPDGTKRNPSSLDQEYEAKIDMEFVISMYNEEVDTVAAMIAQVRELLKSKGRSVETIVYVKDEQADLTVLKDRLKVTTLVKRPNVGREGEAYLYHILSRFDQLATHTLFIQAHVHNFWEVRRRIEAYFHPDTGVLSLGFSGNTCQCNECSDRWGWDDGEVVSSLYGRVYNKTCSTVLLSYKGQFIASARRIRGIDRGTYEYLHSALIDPQSWAHTEPYLRNRPDSMNAPFFGYTLERVWSILLQCSEPDIALKCPTLLSGTRRGGRATDCQCLDSIS